VAKTFSLPQAQSRMAFIWLIVAALLTIVLWQVPWGNYILYPFTLLATWFHEMAHGLAAILLGGHFNELKLFPNGSGVALYSYSRLWGGDMGLAIVAASGPLGPAIAGAVFILAGRYYQSAHWCLVLLGMMLFLSAAIWVRSGFGWTAVSVLGGMILLIASYTPQWVQSFAIQFLGVQACISVYRQLDYLFTYKATIDGTPMLSDTGQMAEYLALPHWFWGGSLALLSLVLLATSLHLAYRR